jgi:uncharacterized membrane protein YkoI
MISRRRLAASLVCASLVAVALAPAWGDDDDQEAAEAALARGDARPVRELLERVARDFPGSVLKIELEDDGGSAWVYEVKLLTAGGDVLELEYDADTLELLELEGRHRDDEDD